MRADDVISALALQAAAFRSPRGAPVTMHAREGTSDGPVLETVLGADEYRLADLRLEGWAIDLGAHVGGVTVALLADNPGLHVIAIEPVPENVAVLERNVEPWALRCHIVQAVAGDRQIAYGYGGIPLPADYAAANHFVAGPVRADDASVIEAETITLAGVLDTFGIGELALLKTDCEGGEWAFLADPEANARVQLIRGEFHDDPTLGQAMVELLAATHDVTILTPGRVVGLFEARRR